MVSDERALAVRLASTEDDALARTFADRGVAASAPWHDFFDAAAGMLDPASVERAVARLPRTSLVALFAALDGASLPASELAVLRPLALVGDDGAPFGAVAARVRAASIARPDAFVTEPPAPPVVAANDSDAAAAAERAFTTVGALADVLLAGLHTPLSRTGTGAVSAIDRRRLTDAGALGSVDDIDDLVAAAAAADLVTPLGREWIVTDAGTQWLEATTTRRWAVIAEGLRSAVPAGLRTDDGGFRPLSSWAGAYPLHAEWTERSARLRRIAEAWGLITAVGTEPRWTETLRAGASPDTESLAAHMPAEIDRVYLQADLTAIAPGPLAPALDLRLRTIATRESRAQASTYRFSTESLGTGMTEGETADSIREFLRGISLTGIPQPLDYLVESTAARHGLIRVRADEADGTHASRGDRPGAARHDPRRSGAAPAGVRPRRARARLAGGARRGVLVARRRALPGRRPRRIRRSGVSAPPHAGRGFDGPHRTARHVCAADRRPARGTRDGCRRGLARARARAGGAHEVRDRRRRADARRLRARADPRSLRARRRPPARARPGRRRRAHPAGIEHRQRAAGILIPPPAHRDPGSHPPSRIDPYG